MPATAEPFVYLNGQFLPKHRAHLSIEERGVFFADGVYEVTRSYGGRLFAVDHHLARLRRSLNGVRLAPPPDLDALPRISQELLLRNRLTDAKIYWQISRGPAPRDPRFTTHATEPTVVALVYPMPPLDPSASPPRLGAVLAPDERWSNCWIKTLMLLPNALATNAAIDAGADAAILHRDGRVTEGASTNVFVVRDGVVHTHPADRWVLHGVTRGIILELARDLGLPVREEAVTTSELLTADEVFLTGTTTHVAAVTQIDGRVIGEGLPGPVTVDLHRALLERIQTECCLASTISRPVGRSDGATTPSPTPQR